VSFNSDSARRVGCIAAAWVITPLALALLLKLWQGLYHYPGSWMLDLKVYRFAMDLAFSGVDPYSVAQSGGKNVPIGALPVGGLSFVYPPFSLLLFAPFALLSLDMSGFLWTALSVAALQVSIFYPLKRIGVRQPLAWAVGSTVPALLLSPVDQALQAGQLSLVLLGMVVLDLHLPEQHRLKGVLIGLAAGLKIIPAIFVLYLVVTRQFRAAAVAALTAVGTVAAGLILFPRYSISYWSVLVFDTDRIAPPGWIPNESLRAMLARVFHDGHSSYWPWLASTVVVVVAAFLLVRHSIVLGEETLGITGVAVLALLVSPVSWHHYWVWLVPIIVYVVHLAMKYRSPLLWACITLPVLVVALRVNEWFMPMPPYNALELHGAPLVTSSMCTIATIALLFGLLAFATIRARRVDPRSPVGSPRATSRV
jgi:alpha-1,2-mannosyltransferase